MSLEFKKPIAKTDVKLHDDACGLNAISSGRWMRTTTLIAALFLTPRSSRAEEMPLVRIGA
ncbi:hypothetical protein ACSTKP_23785, partial [Vibrio parahaemolyticus]